MATRDQKTPTQPTEDMFGRPTSPRRDEEEQGPSRDAQGEQKLPARERTAQGGDKDADEEASYGGVGELSDGDGVRSDKGTNPLPSSYWSAYPANKPGED
jgi:hypothetical protein